MTCELKSFYGGSDAVVLCSIETCFSKMAKWNKLSGFCYCYLKFLGFNSRSLYLLIFCFKFIIHVIVCIFLNVFKLNFLDA